MALPRLGVDRAGRGAGLPQPLAPSEAARIRRIFALQSRGRMLDAAREIAGLPETVLRGHLLADWYLGPFHRASPAELADWMARYPDHPEAQAIHDLLQRRSLRGTALPDLPRQEALRPVAEAVSGPEDDEPGASRIPRDPALDRAVHDRVQAGDIAGAVRWIAGSRWIGAAYGALLRAEVAQTLFARNQDAEALRLAGDAFHRSAAPEEQVGLAGYVAGLAAWRLERHDLALSLFEGAAQAGHGTSWLRAAAAFWAARAHVRTGDPGGYAPWMRRAAAQPRTFYGLLARRIRGLDGDFAGDRNTLGGADLEAVAATPHGLRAFALLQVGQLDRAEAELRLLWPEVMDNPSLRNAVLLVAREAGLTDLAAQIAALMRAAEGKPRSLDRRPLPKLRPRDGFRVDPALVYALTRRESNFDPGAVSPMGARGLMQLMPTTAGSMAGDPSLADRVSRLHDPALNLELGQRYVGYLAEHDGVEGDLIRLLASYNAGPNGFARRAGAIRDGGDPLLFIEAIPLAETRAFVQHVLAYTWIYAMRLRLPAPSLDQLAGGAFPRFTPVEPLADAGEGAPRRH